MTTIVRPEDVGLNSARLARIDHHLREQYIDAGRIAGAVTLVARHGQIAHFSALGLADRERKRPMTEDTIFRIYSMTKPVTSIAMMMLIEQARCSLTDAVHRHIPEWENLRVHRYGAWPAFVTEAAHRPMTIRDLLTHTSGLTYGFTFHDAVDAGYRRVGISGGVPGEERPTTLRDMVEKLAKMPLLFSPGTRWNYSVSTDVVGYLVEKISGEPFDEFLRKNIFEPLGMRDTGFRLPDGQAGRFAANYRRQIDKRLTLEDDPENSPYLPAQSFFSGGGGLVSTATDYARFCQMLLNGGIYEGARIVSRKTLELMVQNYLPGGGDLASCATGSFSETTNDGIGFGLGFAIVLDLAKRQGHGSLGEFYWGGAASTAFWVDPEEDLFVVFLTQLMPSTAYNFRGQLRSLVYAAIEE
ncbi:MAG TPA: serine hydrolase domain-containing protein [Polyangiales bacterium]|nr:serine hydrolase domain-containing protein [Polyangiales bacterium]